MRVHLTPDHAQVDCRRRLTLRYFGEEFDPVWYGDCGYHCGARKTDPVGIVHCGLLQEDCKGTCDNCRKNAHNPAPAPEDITGHAQVSHETTAHSVYDDAWRR